MVRAKRGKSPRAAAGQVVEIEGAAVNLPEVSRLGRGLISGVATRAAADCTVSARRSSPDPVDTQTIIVIALASAGVVLGLVALLAALFTRLAVARLSRDVQALQHVAGQEATSAWMKDRELESTLKVRRLVLKAIQKVKDELEPVLHPPEGGPDRQAVLVSVSAAGKALFTMAQEASAKLNKNEQAALARARDTALEVSSRLRGILESMEGSALPERERQVLIGLRSELGEAQQVFRDLTIDRVVHRVLDRGANAEAVPPRSH
jgi:hypothetical protein